MKTKKELAEFLKAQVKRKDFDPKVSAKVIDEMLDLAVPDTIDDAAGLIDLMASMLLEYLLDAYGDDEEEIR